MVEKPLVLYTTICWSSLQNLWFQPLAGDVQLTNQYMSLSEMGMKPALMPVPTYCRKVWSNLWPCGNTANPRTADRPESTGSPSPNQRETTECTPSHPIRTYV